ncbi:MAG TPA: selenocysteine-specific translation elongation factor [Capillimicrobium sp.]|nr:selenocysteine-specific translation elongation factor [Capillimicrobium sp.]
MADADLPLTLGTAGHVDHGKTTLVQALTGVDTDRLPEEKTRGISIALGYAPLTLPSGRRVSIVDVPGHERFVRTMVSGATGVDLYLMTVAADDGVMPQTREHALVLAALGIETGVVAITKADVLDPALATEEVAELLPGVPAIPVSARTGAGLGTLRAALDAVAAEVPARGADPAPALLHIDRAFTIHGAGTVVTGTLHRGSIGRGDTLALLPSGRGVRVRGVQVHDQPLERAPAGQRVAVNLIGVDRDEVGRGDVLAGEGSPVAPAGVLDVETALDLHGTRVHVHHGTRETPARGRRLDDGRVRLRLERPLMAVPGDRVVVRAVAPPTTLGGGVVATAHPPGAVLRRRPPRAPEPAAEPAPAAPPQPPPLDDAALAVEAQLREAGASPPTNTQLDSGALDALRAHGRAVRVGRNLHVHPEVLADVEARVRAIIEDEGSITLARLRDELQTGRKVAQALLEHFDGERLTIRRPDDSRVLRRRGAAPS